MNQSRKLGLSKETLRCLDDQDLTGVVGGGGGHGHGNENSDGCSGICVSFQCDSFVCTVAVVCIG